MRPKYCWVVFVARTQGYFYESRDDLDHRRSVFMIPTYGDGQVLLDNVKKEADKIKDFSWGVLTRI